jgi:hypothetical protein
VVCLEIVVIIPFNLGVACLRGGSACLAVNQASRPNGDRAAPATLPHQHQKTRAGLGDIARPDAGMTSSRNRLSSLELPLIARITDLAQ